MFSAAVERNGASTIGEVATTTIGGSGRFSNRCPGRHDPRRDDRRGPPGGSTAKTTYDPAGNASDRCFWKPGAVVGDCRVVGSVGWPNPPTQSTSTVSDARNQRVQRVDGLRDQLREALYPRVYP